MIQFILFTLLSLGIRANSTPATLSSAQEPQPSPELNSFFTKWLAQNPQTLKEALTHIPEPYWKNFALMKDSRSIQQSSPENPRVFLYGKTAETIISFNGDPKHRGFNRLEIADFDPNTKTINFYEVQFKNESKKKDSSLSVDEIWQETSNLKISKANPNKCMGCHEVTYRMGRNEISYGRYIWDSYNKWTGAYGEFDDKLTQSTDPNYESEEVKFFKFKQVAQADKNSRYHQLIFEGTHPQAPYLDPTSDEARAFKYMPNSKLGTLLAIHHSRMVANVLVKQTLKDNRDDELKKWICKNASAPHGFPESLSFMSSDPWLSGNLDFLDKRDLKDMIKLHTAYQFWNLNSSWKNFEVADFYQLLPEQNRFIAETGLLYQKVGDFNWLYENQNRFKNTYCVH